MASWRDTVAREIPSKLSGEVLASVEAAWQVLGEAVPRAQHGAEELERVEERLRRLECCDNREAVHLLDGWAISAAAPYTLCLLASPYETMEEVQEAGGWITSAIRLECRLAALLSLRSDGGRATVRPETVGDKVAELFNRREVDFEECPEFSRRYYVLATQEERLRRALPPPALDHLGSRGDLVAEVCERDMLVHWPSTVRAQAALEACDFFGGLAARLGPAEGAPYR